MAQSTEHDDPLNQAAAYCSGALSSTESERFEEKLRDGCAMSNAGVAAYSRIVESLADLAEPVEPPGHVRDALFARIAEPPRDVPKGDPQVWRNWDSTADTAGMVVVRRDEGAWEETGVAGVRIRRLFVDRNRNQFTGLVRMEPGTAYPRHVHDGPEECLVLEGELLVGDDLTLNAGDYQYAAPDSLHAVQSTKTGCLLLITSSLSDEMV